VIGAGVVGLELGSVWRRWAEVTLLEALPAFCRRPTSRSRASTQAVHPQGLKISSASTSRASTCRRRDQGALSGFEQGGAGAGGDKLIVSIGG